MVRREATRILLFLVVLQTQRSRCQGQNQTTTDIIGKSKALAGNATATTTKSTNGGPLAFNWFQTPAAAASDLPSSAPSTGRPAIIASRTPSRSPWSRAPWTLTPSQTPSSRTTQTPSTVPSPSMIPSLSPSWLPSISPTPICHDQPTYTSPLNDFQCHDHAGTDCFRWRFLGLTAVEVKELVESCPVTCHIPCGELVTMMHQFTFVLRNMENFLSPESTLLLQTTMIDYLNDFVQPRVLETNRFIVIAAELTSQQLLDEQERRHYRQFMMRHLTITTTTATDGAGLELQVTMELHAFAVGLDYDIMNALLIEGIENLGLGLALRLTNDEAFRSTETSMTRSPSPVPPNEPQQAVMEPMPPENAEDANNRSLMWLLGLTLALLVGVTVYLSMLVARKLKRSGRLHKRQLSDLSAGNQTSAVQIQQGNSSTSAFGQVLSFETIVRVMSSCSPASIRSKAKRKVHEVDEDSVYSGDDTHNSGSSCSGADWAPQNVDEHSVVHPLTGIIPPMIVYDGFDGNETFKTKSVVPSRKLHAPPTFLEALLRQEGGTMMDNSLYDGIISYDGSDCSEDMEIQEATTDSETGSFNENSFPTQFPSLPPRPPSANATRETRCRSPLRSLAGDKVHPDASILPLPRVMRSSSTSSWESFRQNNVGAKQPSPEKSWIYGFTAQSLASSSPKKKWKIPFSLNAVDPAQQLPQCPDEDGQQLIFHAPRKGKLGLVIQCIDLKGPVVTTVKTYSPLLGQILPGDRILDIDGTTTTGMTLKDVTGIMGGKIAAQSNRRVTVFRIVVFRPIQTKKDEILGMLNENPESSALLLSDSPCLEHALHLDPVMRRGSSFGEVMRIS